MSASLDERRLRRNAARSPTELLRLAEWLNGAGHVAEARSVALRSIMFGRNEEEARGLLLPDWRGDALDASGARSPRSQITSFHSEVRRIASGFAVSRSSPPVDLGLGLLGVRARKTGVVAFDVLSGAEVWRCPKPALRPRVAVQGELVGVRSTSRSGVELVLIRTRDGRMTGRVPLGWPHEPHRLAGVRVLANDEIVAAFRVSRTRGGHVWSKPPLVLMDVTRRTTIAELPLGPRHAPIGLGPNGVCLQVRDEVRGFDRAGGELWRTDGALLGAVGERLLVEVGRGVLRTVSAESGEVIGERARISGRFVGGSNDVAVFDDHVALVGVDAQSLKVRWRIPSWLPQVAATHAALVVTDFDERDDLRVRVLDPVTGTARSTSQLGNHYVQGTTIIADRLVMAVERPARSLLVLDPVLHSIDD